MTFPHTLGMRPRLDRRRALAAAAGLAAALHVASGAAAQTPSPPVRAAALYPKLRVEPPPPGTEHNPPVQNQPLLNGINGFTGAFSMVTRDFSVPFRYGLPGFYRTYTSNDSRVGALGPGWTHSYAVRLVDPGDGSGRLVVVGAQGRSQWLELQPDGVFRPPAGWPSGGLIELVHGEDDTWRYTSQKPLSARETVDFDEFGNATSLFVSGIGTVTLSHDWSTGRLLTVTEGARGNLQLEYDEDTGRLVRVADWLDEPAAVRYDYDDFGRLVRYTDQLERVLYYTYHGATHHLEAAIAGNLRTYFMNEYDETGRVIAQRDGTGRVTQSIRVGTVGVPLPTPPPVQYQVPTPTPPPIRAAAP